MIADTWYLFLKYVRISIRAPLWTLFNLIQPLIWLVIFGQLFSRFAQVPDFPTGSYTEFFIPGVLIMTVLFGSSWSGISLLREINSGTVDKMLVAPIARSSIVLSRVFHAAIQVVVQTLIIMTVARIMGNHISMRPDSVLLSLLIIFLLGLAFASVSNGLAIALQREEPLVVLGNMMTMPLLFFSSAMVPKTFMPAWMQMLANINPIEYAVVALRTVLLPPLDTSSLLLGLVVVAGFAFAMLYWSVTAFAALRD